tara:strand:- start:356 stop:1348 length:993 start_codon:yes stop_codon:yes gene_type:complete
MRYAQTVRFNLSTDREKIDSSSLEVQAAIDLTNAASGEKTLTGTETGDYLDYLIKRSPQRDDNPDDEFIIINNTNENIELGSDITFTEKPEDPDEVPAPILSVLRLNGGKMNLFKGGATLQISDVQNINDVTPTHMSELTDQSFSMTSTEDTDKEEKLFFDCRSLSIIDTNTSTNDVENRIDIEPNKINFTTKTEEVRTGDSTTTNPTSSILGVNPNTDYSEIIIDLDTPHNSGPEYKLTINTIGNGPVQTVAFTMNINNGNWFDKVVNYTEINVDSFKTGADIITFSRNMSNFNAGNENLFYMRDSNQIKISWKESFFDGIYYELIQVA